MKITRCINVHLAISHNGVQGIVISQSVCQSTSSSVSQAVQPQDTTMLTCQQSSQSVSQYAIRSVIGSLRDDWDQTLIGHMRVWLSQSRADGGAVGKACSSSGSQGAADEGCNMVGAADVGGSGLQEGWCNSNGRCMHRVGASSTAVPMQLRE